MKTKGFFLLVMMTLNAVVMHGQLIPENRPLIVGHRGASHDAPENTLASINLAWKQNADAAEIDIYLTTDHKVVVIHDENTKRVSGISMDVSKSNADDLRKLDVGSWKNKAFEKEKIPFLEEILATIPDGKYLFIEIKCGPEIVPFLKPILEKSGKIKQCLLISFQMDAIVEAKKCLPEVPMYFLSEKITPEEFPNVVKQLKQYNLQGLDLYHLSITPQLMSLCKTEKIPVAAWTVDKPETAKKMEELGVFAITTNVPGDFMKIVGNQKNN